MFFDILKIILLGIIEGITEWLPISSTGHMILFEAIFKIHNISNDFYPVFLYAIQLSAIIAIISLYFSRLYPFSIENSKNERKTIWETWYLVIIGVIPSAIIGLIFDDFLDILLTDSGIKCYVVAASLIFYGFIFILVEKIRKNKAPSIYSVDSIGTSKALKIGMFQVLSIIPGTSRSGTTVLGAELLGINAECASEFSFFMAVPIMFGVSFIKIVKYVFHIFSCETAIGVSKNEILLLFISSTVSFIVSIISVKFLMDFVKKHSFTLFGYYRIFLGITVFLFFLQK